MPNQEQLSRIFEQAEDHRLIDALPVSGWGDGSAFSQD